MQIYYLEPKNDDTSDPRWEATFLREGCWVAAGSETLARAKVQLATLKPVPWDPEQKMLYSPWPEPRLADCWIDNRPNVRVPDGVIVTLGGKTIP
jgi:hypothetical protein